MLVETSTGFSFLCLTVSCYLSAGMWNIFDYLSDFRIFFKSLQDIPC
jgi:hypothetical protein